MPSPQTTPVQHHQQPTQPSRRDNSSISSTHSRGGTSERDRERSSRSANSHPPVESAVTKLLVSIKLLLEALTHWSTLGMTETQVSDVYVRLGNDFNAAVAAFRSINIEMSELLSVPDDLRAVLEQCLSEDATPANLEIYLPTVRQIITSLLQGLRSKQQIYRRIVSDRRHRAPDSQGSERDSRSSRSSRTDSTSSFSGTSRSSRSRSGFPSDGSSARGSLSETQRRVTSSNRSKDTTQSLPSVSRGENGHSVITPLQGKPSESGGNKTPSHRREQSRSTSTPSRPPTDYSESTKPRSTTPAPLPDTDNDTTITVPSKDAEVPSIPRSIVRYSLTDNPVPAVVVDGTSRPQSPNSTNGPGSPLFDSRSSIALNMEPASEPVISSVDPAQAPVIESSLAALKKSDVLERRASKRFSIYNISKMTGGGLKERFAVGRSANRRSIAVDPASLTATELKVLTEEDEASQGSSESNLNADDSSPPRRTRSQTVRQGVPPIPPLPDAAKASGFVVSSVSASDKRIDLPFEGTTTGSMLDAKSNEPDSASSNTLTIFLQVGREVKKATIEKGLSFSSLRVIFVDKFSYHPGQDNFPGIYIRDPSSGVMYELEDMEEVKDKCLLSLNIDPLDQIKQHIDQQMSGLTQELKELQLTVGSKRTSQLSRQPTIATQPFAESESPVSRPSDKQFQSIARRISRFVASEPNNHINVNGLTPQSTGNTLQPQSTGGSVLSEFSGRIVADLKTQFDEVQNMRRDLGIMRQTYLDFVSQTKESLNSLRSQTQSVRQLSKAKVGGAREFVNAGKSSLDTRTQNVLTRVEELQDTVETLKEDVLKRSVNPRSNVVKTVAKDIAEVSSELDSLRQYIGTVKPMWKKTWEEELQNIVEEQQFLTHQEEFLQDLLEDYKALSEVFGHVEKVISIRGSNSGRSKAFRILPTSDDKDSGLSTVMMEIRNAAVDPEKRMKAIAANQRSRQKEIASRSDEFEDELKGFVGGKKLRRTGGTEEAERVRQKRNDLALKSMFSTSQSATSNESTTPTSASFAEIPNIEAPASPAG